MSFIIHPCVHTYEYEQSVHALITCVFAVVDNLIAEQRITLRS